LTTSSRIPDFFRRIALKGWRGSPYYTFSSRYPVLRRWLISQLSSRHQKVLSIGCGSGELEREMIKLGRDVTGVDICFEMLQAARRAGFKRVVQADALNLPFTPSSFDLVIFPEAIGYFELESVLPGVARVLKKRGSILITAYPTNCASDKIYKNRSVAELTGDLQLAGFRIADHKLLTIKRSRVSEAAAEAKCQIIYILGRK
jgi:ubiquinone/menaquinone biosynthesis C-methylase UbiE